MKIEFRLVKELTARIEIEGQEPKLTILRSVKYPLRKIYDTINRFDPDRLHLIVITIDPECDTFERLKTTRDEMRKSIENSGAPLYMPPEWIGDPNHYIGLLVIQG